MTHSRAAREDRQQGLSRLGVTALVLLVLAGCGDGRSAASSRQHSSEREYRVAADQNATAQQIIDAGGPVRVAASADRTLVAWRAESDDDEGPQQAAWRLYDERGSRIAEGTLGQVREQSAIPTLTAVADGFLIDNYAGHRLRHVAVDGAISNVTISRGVRPTQSGDVLVESQGGERLRFYHPADQTAYSLPKLPFGNPQGKVLDGRGRLWVLLVWSKREAKVASAAGGAGPWQRTAVPLQEGGLPTGIHAAAGGVFVPTAHGKGMYPRIDGLWQHSTNGTPSDPWSRLPITGVNLEKTLQPLVEALPDGRLVLIGESGVVWVQGADGTFIRATVPGQGVNGLPEVAGSRLFLSFTRDHQLYVSDNDGQSWRVFAR